MPDWLTSDVWDEYLPPSIIGREDATFLVNDAEREVIQHYTRNREDIRFRVGAIVADLNDGIEHLRDTTRDAIVFLRYYDAEGASAIDTSDTDRKRFVEAMRAEIAGVVRHKVETEDQREGVTSQSQGSKSVSYAGGRVHNFPPTFGKYLKPFDLRPRTTHI
jgi:hypothetical protein